jgi:hypothetical protein
MSLLDKIQCFINPLNCKKANKHSSTPLDRYIASRNPQTIEEVERLVNHYMNGTSPWKFNNDNLYR